MSRATTEPQVRLRAADQPSAPPSTTLPPISVITPSFNQGAFIERCIQSVLGQNYANFEHIVFDNCSTDQTLDVLRRYPHVIWASQPDRGQSDALNKALARARGEIIAWINADDYYEPGAFALAARRLSRNTGHMVVLGRVRFVDPAGQVLSTTRPHFHGLEYLIDFWSHEHGLTQPGMFIRREAFDAVGGLDPTLHYAMDYDLWLRLAARYPIEIVDNVVAGFVVHPASKTGQSRFHSGFRQELRRVSRRYWGSRLSTRYWQYSQACAAYTADLLVHAILDSHRNDSRLDWALLRELARTRPASLLNRYVLAVLGERLCGPRLWNALHRVVSRSVRRP